MSSLWLGFLVHILYLLAVTISLIWLFRFFHLHSLQPKLLCYGFFFYQTVNILMTETFIFFCSIFPRIFSVHYKVFFIRNKLCDHCCWLHRLYRVAHCCPVAIGKVLFWNRASALNSSRAASLLKTVLLLIWNLPTQFLADSVAHLGLNLFLRCDVTINLFSAAFVFWMHQAFASPLLHRQFDYI